MFGGATTDGNSTSLEEYMASVMSYIKCINVMTVFKTTTTRSIQKPWLTVKVPALKKTKDPQSRRPTDTELQECLQKQDVESAVSKHVNRKLSGRKKCGRKRCTTNRENRRLMRIVKQNPFKNLSELHKEWTEVGVKASRATTPRRVKEFGYSCHIPLAKPLLNQRRLTWAKEKKNWTVAQWSKVLFSDESKVLESGGSVEKLIAQVA
ncbi:hypothetical protein QTP70_027098 [Hemibagrus guttatus]|uniref:Transposase Tc1-like domain-containing protein n=1 Tax=Hemibagrus guttatus TaxID=175788 RepID=A0AAE0UNA6_9TELE|nr:hypothetical protein QTP70_027098 [Hemibagrus guttatus]